MHRPDRLNRLALAVLGLLLVAAGGYGLARAYGAFGTAQEHDHILLPGARQAVTEHHGWFWWAVGIGCVIVALLALAWLRAQFRLPRPANDDLVRSDIDGGTRLRGSAAADALAADVDTLPGVASASARVWGDPATPEVYLRVQMHEDAPLDSLRARIEAECLDRLRRALQVEHLDAHVDLRLTKAEGRTVR